MATRNRNTVVALLLVALTSGACTSVASQRFVSFPSQGQNDAQQQRDRAECEAIATSNKGDESAAVASGAGVGAVGGAVGGVMMGAVSGALSGAGAGSGSLIGLGVGAVYGLIAGAISAGVEHGRRYHSIFVACMTARGYTLGG